MLNWGALDLAEKWLAHAIFVPHYCEVLGMLTRALLKRRQFERVAALWDKFGFDLEKVRHNAARFKAAMSLLDQLERSGELPMKSDLSLLRIFGYVRKVNWIIAPGYYDFYVPPDQRRPEFVGYLVSFQLKPSKRPKTNTWSFTAVAIEPVLKAGQSTEKEI
jgi:hypothetical protein